MVTLTAAQALANSMRQHCLFAPGPSIESIASQIVGLHNTSPVSPYLSLLARLDGFARADLEHLMWESWELARFRAMRLTMFVIPHDLLEIAAAATRHISEPLAVRWLRDSGLSAAEAERLESAVFEALADGPLTSRQLRVALDVPQTVDLPGVVGRMCDKGTLVGGAPPRSWRSSIRQYHRWEEVLPNVDVGRWGPEAASRELILRYIRGYGPVTESDIAWWAGFTKSLCRAALETLQDDVEEVTVDGWPGPLYRILDQGAPIEASSKVKALPLLDPYVQGYRDRERFLEPARFDFVYDGGGNSAATLVSGGRIIGVWQPVERPSKQLRYHLFAGGPSSIRRDTESTLAAAGRLYFDETVDLVYVDEMKPLSAEGGRSAAHPLDSQMHRASRRRKRDA